METNITGPEFPVSENLNEELRGLENVSSFIEENIKKEHIMGAVSLVAMGGNIIHFEASGFADAEENKPMSLGSIFRVYSMTKPVTSVAVMMLAEEGKLELDEPISNLDAALRVQMRVELAKLHDQLNATMIYVTHDQTEAMTLANDIVVLDEGVVSQKG